MFTSQAVLYRFNIEMENAKGLFHYNYCNSLAVKIVLLFTYLKCL